jgi:hypothetical protein
MSFDIPPAYSFKNGGHTFVHGLKSDLYAALEMEADRFRVSGSSTLVTYSGSTLNNGGTIASRRLPKNVDFGLIHPSDRYDFLREMPGSYSGPLKDGSWGFWLPENVADLNMQPMHNASRNGPVVVFSGYIDDPTQTITVTNCLKLNFSTISRLYTHTYPVMCPEAYAVAITILGRLTSCTKNDTHLDLIRRVLKFVGAHSAQIKSGAKTAATVALDLAPIIASII